MTIEEAKAAKAGLEHTITCALRRFSADTDAMVTYISAESLINLGAPASYRVEVEAKL
jgi:hypothetical protein